MDLEFTPEEEASCTLIDSSFGDVDYLLGYFSDTLRKGISQ